MTLQSFLKTGHRLTEDEVERASREMLIHYARAEKEIKAKIEAIYARVLAGVKPDDYYNTLIQYDRLNKLLAEVQATYTFYYNQSAKAIGETGSLALSNSYYRQLYSLSWQAPVSFVALDRRVVEAAVFGTTRAWQAIPAAARARFEAIHGPLKQYIPQYGSLTDLLTKNRVNDIAKIQQTIVQGFIQGQSSTRMSRALQNTIGSTATNADRIIRTETHRLQAIGDQLCAADVVDQGVKVKKQWIAVLDDSTRDSHANLDGVMVEMDEEFPGGAMYPGGFGDPAEDINCFTGDTTIIPGDGVKNLFRRFYKGPLYIIDSAGGIKLSVTPNHEIFTPSGWVKAKELNNGAEIIIVDGKEVFSGRGPNIENHPVVFEKIYCLFKVAFPLKRMSTVKENFHGDGIINGDVDIISVNGHLMSTLKPGGSKGFKKICFPFTDIRERGLFHLRTLAKLCQATAFSFCSNMASLILSFPFLRRHIRPFDNLCFTPSPRSKPGIKHNSVDDIPGNIEKVRDFINRHSIHVKLDNIISVKVIDFSGHVYNLENKDNYYMANSSDKVNSFFAVVHNCRCVVNVIVIRDGEPLSPQMRRGRDPETGEYKEFRWQSFNSWAAENNLTRNRHGELYTN